VFLLLYSHVLACSVGALNFVLKGAPTVVTSLNSALTLSLRTVVGAACCVQRR